MTVPIMNPQAIFPDLPRNQPFLNENGSVNDYWLLFFENLVMALQTNFKPEGFVIPTQSTSNIALLTGVNSNNNIIYDSTANQFKGNIAGTWKTFTLT
jgi:hypothetical protein